MDPRRLNASTQLASAPTDAGAAGFGTLEVWNIKAGGTGWSHPVHVHFEEGIILSRGGKAPPEWEKTTFRSGDGFGPKVTVKQ